MKEKLEELTKETFEHNIANIVESYNKDIQRLLKILRVSDYYTYREYLVKYFYDPKENIYSIKYSKKEIGFKPDYKKILKKDSQLKLF